MKKLFFISSVAVLFVFSSASAQKTNAAPQPVPMTAAPKVQNSSQQNSTAPAPKPGSTDMKKPENRKAEPAPAFDNKIAVNDAGTPGDKSAAPKKSETKKANTNGVSPK